MPVRPGHPLANEASARRTQERHAEPVAGATLGRYELLAPVASGGMAQVWAARLRGTRGFQKIVAIKTMLPALRDLERFEAMFLDEATLAARVKHPHVVEILDLGEQQGVLYLVMEWIDGEAMTDILRAAAGPVPAPIAVRIAMQASAGLHAAHELRDADGKPLGLVHRDVSPQNVLVTLGGIAKLVDFGIAAAAKGGVDPQGVELRGKAAYAAPEQVFDGPVDRRTDIFALGILLYEMTTGVHPFLGENDLDTMNAICSPEPVRPPHELAESYPPELERVVLKALEKEPADRFQTANDLLRALDLALPASDRASTDEDVAAFVRRVRGAEHDERAKLLDEALRAADVEAASARDEVTPPASIAPALPRARGPARRGAVVAATLAGAALFVALSLGLRRSERATPLRPALASLRSAVARPIVDDGAASGPAKPANEPPAASAVAPASAEPQPAEVPASAGSASSSARSAPTPRAPRPRPSGSAFRSPVRAPGF